MPIITFSRTYPAYHPKAGQPTLFVEGIINSLGLIDKIPWETLPFVNDFYILDGSHKKHHTIRAGNRFKAGDKFSPRVWSGKPYASKQIVIAPDIEVKKVWKFELWKEHANVFTVSIDGENRHHDALVEVAKNDGLLLPDMFDWFQIHPKSKQDYFAGQILCWNDKIEY